MSERQVTQSGLVGLFLVGLLAVSGCAGGGDTEGDGAKRASVAEDAPTETGAPLADSSISPVADAPPVVADEADATPPTDAKPLEELTASSEEPPPAAVTESPPPPVEEPPPADDTAADEAASESATPAEGELVTVADTKPGLTRVGPTKCKICHKVQYASWAESKHAERTPPLDCESCHGSGSEYKKKSIMKDPELARAAGLVTPKKAFCMRCHLDDWQDDMMEQAHAHKEDDAG